MLACSSFVLVVLIFYMYVLMPGTPGRTLNTPAIKTPGGGSNHDLATIKTTDHALPTVPVKKQRGHLLGLHFSDQMTGAITNVLCLQCWARQLDLLVVEPFAVESYLGASLNVEKQDDVRMSDIFDSEILRKHSKEKGYSPLVSWEEFLNDAPRDVVLVSQPWQGNCDKTLPEIREIVAPFAKKYNFTVVHEVCFNFLVGGSEETSKSFNAKVFDKYDPQTVTVMIDRWGGIQRGRGDVWRMVITDSDCPRNVGEAVQICRSSESIVNDAQKYDTKYLNGNLYNAVMIRFQYFFINHQLDSKREEVQSSMIDGCLESILSKWKELKSNYSTLLTMDFGSYGSTGLHAGPWLDEKIRHFFDRIYGTALSLEQWEESFESIARKKSRAYIAQMQKELAGRSQCLVLAGAAGMSAFQHQARTLHDVYHSGTTVCNAEACS